MVTPSHIATRAPYQPSKYTLKANRSNLFGLLSAALLIVLLGELEISQELGVHLHSTQTDI